MTHRNLQSKRRLPAVLLAVGLCTSVAATAQAETYEYDFAGRLVAVYYENGHTVRYAYDDAGNRVQATASAITDADGDMMDDDWETTQLGTTARDGTGDLDGDGITDRDEFLAGTDPDDDQSVLQIVASSISGGSEATVSWSAVSGKRYRVQYKESADAPTWYNLLGDVVAGGPVSQKTDSSASASQRVYRVLLVP